MSKIVFITGASSGIGQALALNYIQQKYHVVLVARRINLLQAWCEQNQVPTTQATLYQGDVRNEKEMSDIGKQCIMDVGVPDIVIAAAGISIGVDTEIFSDIAVMRKVYETNNIGMMATFNPFIKSMKKRGEGKLVGIASVAGIRGLAGHGAYCSSKAAVISYCESLRLEMRTATGSKGVKVLTISPGFVATPLTQNNPYKMPFLLTSDEFARRAICAIEQEKSYCVIPWQMGIVAKLMRILPNWAYDRIFSGRKRKPREGEV